MEYKKNNQVKLLSLGNIDYSKCVDLQKKLQKEIIDIKLFNRKNNLNKLTPNYLLIVEHDHVYTLGKSGNTENLLYSKSELKAKNIQFHETSRGGDITYHGPGQLVIYPILDLENFFTDIHKYLRFLELAVINTLKDLNIHSSNNPNKTGVWLDVGKTSERKICAMGVKVSRWVTMHGLALNVNCDLEFFNGIVPCGLDNRNVTSIKNEIQESISLESVSKIFIKNFLEIFNSILVD
jgi:lipoyl(octanoyl) transferase